MLLTVGQTSACRSLTAVSHTGGTAPDLGVLAGHPADPDLRQRTPADWPDGWHATTD
jgi:hypothetical protein